MNLINLQGWPKPAGWNSGRPVGSVVLIYSAIALRWFIYLIGMNSKILFISLLSCLPFHTLCFTPINMHTLCWMSCLSSSKREKKPTCQYSLVRSGLTFWDAHCTDCASAFRHINETEEWLMCICCLSFPFSSHLIPSGSWRARAYPSVHCERDSLHMLF